MSVCLRIVGGITWHGTAKPSRESAAENGDFDSLVQTRSVEMTLPSSLPWRPRNDGAGSSPSKQCLRNFLAQIILSCSCTEFDLVFGHKF